MELWRRLVSLVFELFKWIIVARVVISFLPRFGMHINSYHPVIRFIEQVTDPILRPLQRFGRMGMVTSALVVFLLITFVQQFTLRQPISRTIAFLIVFAIALSVHEFAHAWTAFQLGDPTAKNAGRLTLDPRKHLDVIGSLMVLTAGFGWAKPVPVNPDYLRNGRKEGMLTVAAAGPLSNLALAIIGAVVLNLGVIGTYYSSSIVPNPRQIVEAFVGLNVALFFFNLLPIAPLDGFRVAAGLLPYPTSEAFRKLEPIGPVILIALILLVPALIRVPTDLLVGLMT